LAKAFRKFDQDDKACAAVLWGAGGNFCAGADLKAIFAGREPTVFPRMGTVRWVRPGWFSRSR